MVNNSTRSRNSKGQLVAENKATNEGIELDLYDHLLKNHDEKHLEYLYLRNIRNIKSLTNYQSTNLKSFLQMQYNLNTLDLVGLYLNSKFIVSILSNLKNLK